MSYGDVAEYTGTRSARRVGRVLALHGATVPDLPWQRVVRADGSLATHKADRQRERLEAEGVRFAGDRVDMARHRWDGS
jgi:alkylated DNA nucleotide flippase Atl1